MTRTRRLAKWILSWVVWLASPGCKEWAEGLAREAAVIDSDWSALRWSLGSTRVLLDRREAPLTSLDDVPAATQKLVDLVRGGTGLWLIIMQGPLYLLKFFSAKSNSERVGCVLVVLASIIAGIFYLIERRRLKVPWYDEIYDDSVACAHLYIAQLKHCDRLWIVGSTFLCLEFGTILTFLPRCTVPAILIGFMSPLCLLVPVAMLQKRQNNLRRIEEINALLAERDGVHSL